MTENFLLDRVPTQIHRKISKRLNPYENFLLIQFVSDATKAPLLVFSVFLINIVELMKHTFTIIVWVTHLFPIGNDYFNSILYVPFRFD